MENTPTTVPNQNAPISYKQTTNTVPTFGEQNAGVLALQKSLNAKNQGIQGWTALAEDGKYGPLTQAGTLFKAPTTTTDPNATSSTTDPSKKTTAPTTTPPQSQAEIDNEALSKKRLADAEKVSADILAISNGSVPLSAGEQAQVDGLTQEFQQMISDQKLTNTGASGLANVRGYQTGAAEYDPTFQVKTIGSIVTAGLNKVASLNVKMASAVAALTTAFRDKKIENIKSAFDTLDAARKERQVEIQRTIENTQKVIKEEQEKKQKMTDSVNAIALDAKKNGAPKEIVDAITSSDSVSGALAASGDYLQTATGDLGNFLQYKRETQQKGLTPMEYGTWLDKEEDKKAKRESSKAYSSAYASAAGKAAAEAKYGGAGTLKETQAEKNNLGFYLRAKDSEDTVDTLEENISKLSFRDQVALQTLPNWLQSSDNQIYRQAQRQFTEARLRKESGAAIPTSEIENDSKTYFIQPGDTPETLARKKKAREQVLNSLKIGAGNAYKNYGEIENTVANNRGEVDNYIQANPQQAETIAKLYELPGWDDNKVWEYIQLTEKK